MQTLANVPTLQQYVAQGKYSPQIEGLLGQAFSYALPALAQGTAPTTIDRNGRRVPANTMPQFQMSDYSKNLPDVGQLGLGNAISSLSLQSLQNAPSMNLPEFDFKPIEEEARAGFEQQTVPTIAERFTNMGAGASSSSAFARNLGSAAAGLEQSLASLKAKTLPQFALQKAQLETQRAAMLGGLDSLKLQQAQAADNAALQRAQLQQQQAQFGLGQEQYQNQLRMQQANYLQQQQQLRTQQLLGMLGFNPPQTVGQPYAREVMNPGYSNFGNQAVKSWGSGAAKMDFGVGFANPAYQQMLGIQGSPLYQMPLTQAWPQMQALGYDLPKGTQLMN